jgi:hypothetical protein
MDLFEKTVAEVRQLIGQGRLKITNNGTYMAGRTGHLPAPIGEAPVCEVCALGALVYALPRPDPRDNNEYMYDWSARYSLSDHGEAMRLVSPLRKYVSEIALNRLEYAFMYQRWGGMSRDDLLGLLPEMRQLEPADLREMETYFPQELPGRERLLALITNLELHRVQPQDGPATYCLDFSVPWTDLLQIEDIAAAWQHDKSEACGTDRPHHTYRTFARKTLQDPSATVTALEVARSILDREEIWQSKDISEDDDEEDDSYFDAYLDEESSNEHEDGDDEDDEDDEDDSSEDDEDD